MYVGIRLGRSLNKDGRKCPSFVLMEKARK